MSNKKLVYVINSLSQLFMSTFLILFSKSIYTLMNITVYEKIIDFDKLRNPFLMIGNSFSIAFVIFIISFCVLGSVFLLISSIRYLIMFFYYLIFYNFSNKVSHLSIKTTGDGTVIDSEVVFNDGETIPAKLHDLRVDVNVLKESVNKSESTEN